MIVLVIVILGAISLTKLPIDLFPEIELPIAIVSSSYSGAGPQEIENLITRPLEGAISTVSKIDTVNSMSYEGNSLIIAQFNFGTDMDLAALEMREKLDMIKGFLPDGATNPMVIKIDPNSLPIMQMALSSTGNLTDLQILAENNISQRLERLEGVASVNISGGSEREVEIKIDENEISKYGLNINQISQIITASNLNLPGGTVNKGDYKYSARIVGEFKSLEDIKDMPIPMQSGDIIKLKDIAEISLKYKDKSSISRINGKDSINISIQKQSGKNTVQVAKLINREVEKLKRDYPNIELDIVMDTSTYIVDSINTVAKNAIFGSLLAILILYIFLKNIRTTLIIGISIPISLIASFILLYFNGISLNMMTLGGLALAVGMLVDSAIVVLENIFRFRTEGHSKMDSAIEGASEVGMAITASTLTTIAVFIPITFIEGMVGTIFKDFALTVTLSLGASLLVSLTLIPMLSSKILTVEEDKMRKRRLDKIYNIFDKFLAKTDEIYRRTLIKSLNKRRNTVIISILIFIVSIVSLFGVGMEFLPATDEGSISINITLPSGSELEKVSKIASEVEGKLTEVIEIEDVFTSISSGNNMMVGMSSSNTANVTVGLVKLSQRNRSTLEVSEEIRNLLKDIPGAKIEINQASSMMTMTAGNPISVSIKGNELDVLEDISADMVKIIESVEGTREVKSSFSEGIPEVEVLINKEMAARYGLTAAQIASGVRSNASGMTVTRFKEKGEEIDVIIRPLYDSTDSIKEYEQIEIITPMGSHIPLSQIADISIKKGPVQIVRENQERVVTVTGQIINRDLRSITTDIESKLKDYDLPDGYTFSFGGENKEMNDAFIQLGYALALAIVLIYMVMAAQFESLIHPFTIMFTVPLAFSGGAFALFISGRSLGVTALIGVIILAGIVVNNGIVLIDYINVLRKEGKDRREAIITAGPIRLRPILMTTLTTILGLVPLALGIGEGSELMAPMATVVIGGLTLSTVLTLILIPVIYTLFDDLGVKMKKQVRGKN